MSERRRRRATDEAADQPSVRRRRYNTRSAAREDAVAETRRRWSEELSARASQASRDTQPRSGSSRRANRSNQRGGGTRRHTQLDQRVNTTSRNRSNAANQRPPRIQLTSRMSTGGRMYAPQLLASLNAQRRSRMARSRELIGRFIRALRATSPVRHRLPSNASTRPRRQERPESRNVFNPVVAIEDIFGGSTSARSVSTRSSDAFAAALRPLIAQSGSGSRLNIRLAFREGDSDSNNSSSDVDFHLGNILNTAEGGDSSADDVFYSDLERLDSDSADSLTSATAVEPPRSYVSISLDGLHSSPTLSISSTEPARSFVSLSPDGLSSSPTPSLSEAETVIHHDTDSEAGDDNDAFRIIHIPVFADSAGSPVIFTRNNVSIDLMRRMSELSDAVFNLRNRLQTHTDGFRGFSPPRNFSLEPTRRRVPESVDCQRSKLTDELNSGTCECVICTDVICSTDQVWPCNNCFNIFHLPCIRRWAKTNRSTEMHGAWICPVCRRPKYCTPNKLRYRCLCGRILKPKSVPGVTPHCCGKQCKHHCGLLCHPGPCRMSPAECEAVAQEPSTSQTAAEPTRSASV